MENIGSTSIIESISPGVVLKKPIDFQAEDLAEKVDLCFSVEPLILQRIGQHPRIVRYLGQQGRGLLLGQASHSNLQHYMDRNPSIDLRQRVLWCRQLAEAISHIHSRGVVHSDLRPRNVLVHENSKGSLDLMLCDFGGSTCDELGLDGGCLPDGPFYHPVFGLESSPALDIFGLGSLFYTILTGRWPYRSMPGPVESVEDKLRYEKEVAEALNQGKYPDLTGMVGENVISACWMRQYETAAEVVRAMEREMPIPEISSKGLEKARHISLSVLVTVIVGGAAAALAVLTHALIQRQA
ncbi:hypothetical protein CP533_2495 [Ophiocordyceps camponoti-saundersi (nom. inval.)]|nr:hypothetical protein CP533_2495 [Ophiocordyceps camponoti-saundersi (nom. inval.)]